MWTKEKIKNKPVTRGYKAAFNLSGELHNIKLIDIRKAHMQSDIDNMDKSHSTKSITKTLYNQLFKFAIENDVRSEEHKSERQSRGELVCGLVYEKKQQQ